MKILKILWPAVLLAAIAGGNVAVRAQKSRVGKSVETKTARTRIRFPEDCTLYKPAGVSERAWRRPAACAEALTAAMPALPREGCDYEDYFKTNSFDELLARAENESLSGRIRFYPLARGRFLVEIVCSIAAYNVSNAYLLYDETKSPARAEVLEFPWLEFEADEARDTATRIENVRVKTLGGRYFNPRTKQLIVFVKARGLGDAGRYARYAFPNGRPKLLEFRAKFSWTGRGYGTDEAIRRPPAAWKIYYPEKK
ncbi:MAG: DUF1176 domain-containing protein [Acidobacteria bacterium]|nr:DUF1176 domain-containing protein [Acidobacteriota bacterium]